MIDLRDILIPVVLFLVTAGFGFWVRGAGIPYQPLPFNVHKLAALAGVILAGWQIRGVYREAALPGPALLPSLIVAASVIVLFSSGGLLSVRGGESRVGRLSHLAGFVAVCLCLGWLWVN